MATIPERFKWAAGLMNLKPEDNVLEIGCGAGLFAEEIAQRIISGSITVIDKSAAMVEKAKKRNQRYMGKQIKNFIVNDFSESQFPANYFDKVVAFNVRFFLGRGNERVIAYKKNAKQKWQTLCTIPGTF